MSVQRFVAVEASGLNVVEVHAHDPRAARRLHATLESLAPDRVFLELSPADAAARVAGNTRVHPFVEAQLAVHRRFGPAQPWAAFEGAFAWGRATGIPIELAGGPSPPELGWWARRRLTRLTRASSARMAPAVAPSLLGPPVGAATLGEALDDLRDHVASQTPVWWAWLDQRRRSAAQSIVASARARGGEAVVVAAAPEGGPLADAIQAAARPHATAASGSNPS